METLNRIKSQGQFGLPGVLPQASGVSLPQWNQVHGNRIVRVTQQDQQCGDCDALWTDVAGVTVAVRTADCVPILLARNDGRVVAAVHAGWRGSIARIAELTVGAMVTAGESPARFSAVIGPSIGPCCYEVAPELLERFSAAGFSDAVDLVKRRLDLWAVNAAQLRAAGVGVVECLRVCTFCNQNPGYASFRRDATPVRQWSFIQAIAGE